MGLNLKKLGDKLTRFGSRSFDQVNMFDNGRTWQHTTPTNRRSVIGQASHNGLTNTVGNLTVKPISSTAKVGVENARRVTAVVTDNPAANRAAQQRINQNFAGSIPGFLTGQAHGVADVATSLPKVLSNELTNWKPVHIGNTPVGFLPRGTAPTTEESAAMQKGLSGLNRTVVGQMVSPAQSTMNSFIPGAKEASKAAGYDTEGSFAKKFIAEPVMGTVGTYGLAKGGVVVGKGGKKTVVSVKNKAQDVVAAQQLAKMTEAGSVPGKKIPVTVKPGPRTSQIPVTVTKKIPVRAVPPQEVLASRYNVEIAKLNKEYGLEQGRAMTAGKKGRQGILSEDSIYADAGYMAKKQAIEQAYKDGTIGQRIPVKDAPVAPKQPKVTQPVADPQVQAKINKIENKAYSEGRPLTASEQTKVGILSQQMLGKPVPKAPKEAPPPPPGQVPLNLPAQSSHITAPKTPGIKDKIFLSTTGMLSRFGEGGKAAANRLVEARNQSEAFQAEIYRQIPTVHELTGKGEVAAFARVLEARSKGERVTASPKIMKAVLEWNKAMPQIRERGLKAGLDIGDLGPNYFPRIYKDLFTREEVFQRMADNMVKEGKAIDRNQAIEQLNHIKEQYLKSYGNIDKSRKIDLPGYEMTQEAISSYIAKASDRITKAEQFGAKGELIDQIKAYAMNEGHDVGPNSTFMKNLDVALGNVNKDTTGYRNSARARTVMAVTKLNTAAISNASQLPVNTATIAGIGRTAKGAVKAVFSKEARADAMKSGAELDHMINNVAAAQTGVRGMIAKNIASPFFHRIEKFNRQATAIVGKDYGNHLAQKGDVQALRSFGVTGKIGKTLTDEQSIQMSQGLVRRAQFKVDPMDLPAWADTPYGKLAAQFRTFGYKQTSFMWNEVLREAVVRRNFVPLARFTATSIPMGSAQIAAKNFIKNKPMIAQQEDGSFDPLAQIKDSMMAVGAGGTPASEGQNIIEGFKYNDPVGAITSAVGGPTVGFVSEISDGVQQGMRTGDWGKLAKTGTRSVPVVGPAVAGRAFPTKEKTYDGPIKEGEQPTIERLDAISEKEESDFKKDKKSGYGIKELSNGKFLYQIGNDFKTADSRDKAHDAIVKDKFKKSDDDIKIDGSRNKVYYKDKAGDIHTQDKELYDYNQTDSKNLLEMDRAYEASDWNKYTEIAQSQWDVYEAKKKFYNPATEQDKIDDLTLKQENLEQKVENYADKLANGKGFGKKKSGSGSGGGGSSSKNVGSAYKYAVSLKAGGSPPSVIKAKQVSSNLKYKAGFKTGTPAKISVRKSKV